MFRSSRSSSMLFNSDLYKSFSKIENCYFITHLDCNGGSINWLLLTQEYIISNIFLDSEKYCKHPERQSANERKKTRKEMNR